MILTPEILRTLGSGADPNDDSCMRGYNAFTSEYIKRPDDLVVTLGYVMNEWRKKIDEGLHDREEGLIYLRWLSRLKTNPKAIRLGGDFEVTSIYRFNSEFFNSFEEAKNAKIKFVSDIKDNVFEHVNVLKHYTTNQGLTTVTVKSREQISEDSKISVHDPRTGTHVFPENLVEFINIIAELKIQTATAIEQKIIDTREGHEAWEIVDE